MQIRRVAGAQALGAPPKSTLVAIGNFDGVHRGHQAVLGEAAAEARERGITPLALTFEPHPAAVLSNKKLAILTPPDRKAELICRIDPALMVVVEPFTRELSSRTPESFVRDLLVRQLGAALVLVGENFRFGHGRAGDFDLLSQLGDKYGYEARVVDLVGYAGGTVSSSRVRALLAEARIREVTQLLGRPHAISGRVVKGDGRGRQIGVPTANLDGVVEALPPHGVYAVLVDRVGEPGQAQALGIGMANIGVRPTVSGGFSIEVHLFDFDADLYGQTLRMQLVERLRAERAFDGLDALRAQLSRDEMQARAALSGLEPDPAAGGAWA